MLKKDSTSNILKFVLTRSLPSRFLPGVITLPSWNQNGINSIPRLLYVVPFFLSRPYPLYIFVSQDFPITKLYAMCYQSASWEVSFTNLSYSENKRNHVIRTGLLQLSVKVFPAFFLKSSIFPSNFSKIYTLFSSTEA